MHTKLLENLEGKKLADSPRCRWEDNNKMIITETVHKGVDWTGLN
jgi:hypothetical protein